MGTVLLILTVSLGLWLAGAVLTGLWLFRYDTRGEVESVGHLLKLSAGWFIALPTAAILHLCARYEERQRIRRELHAEQQAALTAAAESLTRDPAPRLHAGWTGYGDRPFTGQPERPASGLDPDDPTW